MSRKAANKTKAWRRQTELFFYPQEVKETGDDGVEVTKTINMPYLMKGRELRNHRLMSMQAKGYASNLLINLMSRAGIDTISNQTFSDPIDETTVETATV